MCHILLGDNPYSVETVLRSVLPKSVLLYWKVQHCIQLHLFLELTIQAVGKKYHYLSLPFYGQENT